MPFQLSPGVLVVEKDFSTIVPAVSTSAGAYCGPFAWGPVNEPLRISSETDLVSRFGAPTDLNYQSFFTAANFLAYTNNILVTRTAADGIRNAVHIKSAIIEQGSISLDDAGTGYTGADDEANLSVTFSDPEIAGGTTATGTVAYEIDGLDNLTITGITLTSGGSGYLTAPTITISAPAAGAPGTALASVTSITLDGATILNDYEYSIGYENGQGEYGMFAAKYSGSKGNGIRVIVVDTKSWDSLDTTTQAIFDGAPGTSEYATSRSVMEDEMHIAIIDTDTGAFTGTPGATIEKYQYVSKLRDAKLSNGSNNYYKNVINSKSNVVRWMDHAQYEYTHDSQSVLAGESVLSIYSTDTIYTAGAAEISSANTIVLDFSGVDTTTDPAYLAIKAYVEWTWAQPTNSSYQFTLSGSTSNDGIFEATDFVFTDAVADSGLDDILTITTTGLTLVDETAASITLTAVDKADWGSSSEEVSAIDGYNMMHYLSAPVDVVLSGGVDDYASSDGQYQDAYALLRNGDEYDISLIPVGNVSPTVAQYVVQNVAEYRKDCVVYMSPNADQLTGGEPIVQWGSTGVELAKDYRSATNVSSSYAVIDSGSKYQYDRYNDAYRWVPLNGDIAGLCARTDYTADPWYSPGGFNRGQIKNVVKLGLNPNQSDRDELYKNNINPVVSFPGEGVILYGDKTMQAKPSAFDRINVRRLFIVLEKAIAIAAKYQLFEFNDEFTRNQFKNMVDPFLRDVQGRRGIIDFRCVCDDTNNTGEVIDRNEFIADIFIKPARSINFITLNFVAARTSVSFDEIGG